MNEKKRILVAGIPRCGTTLMARAVAGLPPGNQWPNRREPVNGVLKRHSVIDMGNIWTIHKAIFLFGDIVDSILSTRRARMDEKHLLNCRCYKKIQDVDILRRDDLNYEEMFDDWARQWTFPILFLRYETMWNHISGIESFLKMTINMPEKKSRVTKTGNFPGFEVSLIKQTYRSLIKKVENMPDYQILDGG